MELRGEHADVATRLLEYAITGCAVGCRDPGATHPACRQGAAVAPLRAVVAVSGLAWPALASASLSPDACPMHVGPVHVTYHTRYAPVAPDSPFYERGKTPDLPFDNKTTKAVAASGTHEVNAPHM